MSPDLANLLGALRDQPDDEVAYLALADWCLDQPDLPTQARGEHVRLSLELGKLSRKHKAEAPVSRRRREGARAATRPLREQVKAMERQHRVAWLGPLRDLAHRCDFLPGGLLKVEFTSGRIEQAREAKVRPPSEGELVWVSNLVVRTTSLGDLDWLAGMLPAGCVRSFVLGAPENAVGLPGVLARCRWLAGVRALDIHSYYPNLLDIGAAGLVSLDCLASLQELHLSHAEIGLDGCSAIGQSPQLRGLRELRLQRCGLGEDHLRALLAPAFVPPLVALSLERNNLTPAAAGALAFWPGLAKVKKLTLDGNPLGDAGLAALVRSPFLGQVRDLSTQSCNLTSRGLTALARAPLARLAALSVQGNDRIADAGLKAICESPSLPALRQLVHSRSNLRPQTWAALQARFGT
jgi:uncharacterized protein (TIGR02996 family)